MWYCIIVYRLEGYNAFRAPHKKLSRFLALIVEILNDMLYLQYAQLFERVQQIWALTFRKPQIEVLFGQPDLISITKFNVSLPMILPGNSELSGFYPIIFKLAIVYNPFSLIIAPILYQLAV